MPNTASAKKRLRQDSVRRLRNRATKSVLKKRVRAIQDAVAKGQLAEADELFRSAAKQIDRAAARHVIHPNAAARKKSRLQASIKKAKQAVSA